MSRVKLHGGPHDGRLVQMAEDWDGQTVLIWDCPRHGLQPPPDCDCDDATLSFYANTPGSELTFEVLT